MNENQHINKSVMSNQNLPLKKRRTCFVDSTDENQSKTFKQSYNSPSPIVPTPPSSPRIELLRQQYAYFLATNYNTFKQKQADLMIDEHFRKSLGENYQNRCLTPDDSSSNSSIIEQTSSADSIEEHFARSLAKFHSLNATESIVDDHFAKALGTTTWEKLKDKS